jgi:hypothetical protein
VETLVSVGIGGVVLAAVASLSFYTARSMASLSAYTELDQQSRNALDNMSYRIRSATRLTAFSSEQLTFSYNGGTLTYTYSPRTKKLTQNLNGSNTTLLEDCNALSFSVYQRNVVSNSFTQVLASGTNDAKSIIVSWTCARQILGVANTESIQSARLVVRNNP